MIPFTSAKHFEEDVLKTKKNSGVKPLGSRQSDQPGHGMLILRPNLGVDK